MSLNFVEFSFDRQTGRQMYIQTFCTTVFTKTKFECKLVFLSACLIVKILIPQNSVITSKINTR